jgi:hypothetical protein
MYERARIMGGSLELWSQEGSETRVTLKIPLKGNSNEQVST